MKATVDPETRTFTLSGGGQRDAWIGRYPIVQYDQWVRFYAEQQERYAAHAKSYQSAIDALAEISAQIEALRAISA